MYQHAAQNGGAAHSAGATSFCACGDTKIDFNATEANRQTKWERAGTFSKAYVRLTVASITTAATVVLRQNGGSSALTVSCTAGTSGAFQDTTHSVTVVAGDTINWQVTGGSGGGGTFSVIQVDFAATFSGAVGGYVMMNASQSLSVTSTSTQFLPPGGSSDTLTTEAAAQVTLRLPSRQFPACVMENLYVYVSANARTSSTVVSNRINTANGTLTVSIGNSATGAFEDTTHQDNLGYGDKIAIQINPGSGSATITYEVIGCGMTYQDDYGEITASSVTGFSYSTSGTSYFLSAGGSVSPATIEVNAQHLLPATGKFLSNLRVYEDVNARAVTQTVAVRKAGVSGVITLSIGSSATGMFEDAVHSVSYLTTDLLSISIASGASTATATLRWVALLEDLTTVTSKSDTDVSVATADASSLVIVNAISGTDSTNAASEGTPKIGVGDVTDATNAAVEGTPAVRLSDTDAAIAAAEGTPSIGTNAADANTPSISIEGAPKIGPLGTDASNAAADSTGSVSAPTAGSDASALTAEGVPTIGPLGSDASSPESEGTPALGVATIEAGTAGEGDPGVGTAGADASATTAEGTPAIGTIGSDSGSGLDAPVPIALQLPGVAGAYASAPDSVAVSILTDITIDVFCRMNDWTPATQQVFVSKWVVTGNQKSLQFYINSNGTLQVTISSNGSTSVNGTSTVAPTVADGADLWVRMTFNDTTNILRFWTSPDGVTWTQLGTNVSYAVAGIFDSTSPLEIGATLAGTSQQFNGRIYKVKLYAADLGNGSGTPVFNLDFTDASRWTPAATSGTESANNATVTINGRAAVLGSGITIGVAVAVGEAGTALDATTVSAPTADADASALTAEGTPSIGTSNVDASGTTLDGTGSVAAATAGSDLSGVTAEGTPRIGLATVEAGTAGESTAGVATSGADASNAGADAQALAAATADSDSSGTVDSASAAAAVADADSGSDTEQGSLAALLADLDSSTVADAAALAAAALDADTGAALEGTPSVRTLDTDLGSAIDAAALAAAVGGAETGAGQENDPAISVPFADAGTAAETTVGVALADVDASTVADAESVSSGLVSISDSDSGGSADAAALAAELQDDDAGTGDETAAPTIALSDADVGTGGGAETVSAAVSAVENGTDDETGTVAAGTSDAETASVADDSSLLAHVGGNENGTGGEAGGIAADLATTDLSTIDDQAALAAAVAAADVGGEDDAAVAAAVVSDSDLAAAATDAATLLAKPNDVEAGTVIDDGRVDASVSAVEIANADDEAAVAANVEASDDGTGDEAAAFAAGVDDADAATAGDDAALAAELQDDDLALVDDFALVAAVLPVADQGGAVDDGHPVVSLFGSDSGSVDETARILLVALARISLVLRARPSTSLALRAVEAEIEVVRQRLLTILARRAGTETSATAQRRPETTPIIRT